MNRSMMKLRWKTIQMKIKMHWNKLTDKNTRIIDKYEKLATMLQEKYYQKDPKENKNRRWNDTEQ